MTAVNGDGVPVASAPLLKRALASAREFTDRDHIKPAEPKQQVKS